MMYQIIENPAGEYLGADGKRYALLSCTKALGPKGVNINWRSYKTLKNALKGFGLKKLEENS